MLGSTCTSFSINTSCTPFPWLWT